MSGRGKEIGENRREKRAAIQMRSGKGEGRGKGRREKGEWGKRKGGRITLAWNILALRESERRWKVKIDPMPNIVGKATNMSKDNLGARMYKYTAPPIYRERRGREE